MPKLRSSNEHCFYYIDSQIRQLTDPTSNRTKIKISTEDGAYSVVDITFKI
jgi:hypothetical protein